jgi:GT2 family glycosyltransferase
VARPELPSFDLVLATVGRAYELARFLDSLEAQSHGRFRVLLVDQNEDERLEPVVAERRELEIAQLRSERGLSRARNRALSELTGDLVAFPDDDCVYPADLLERVARTLAADAALDGVTGRSVDVSGASSASWKLDTARLTDTNLWNRAISYTIFFRRELVERVGSFDERLGLGAGTPWSSGEEIEYLVRALRVGARIEYDPSLTVTHDERPLAPRELRARGYRDGASLGYILRKHRYRRREIARRLIRPVGGVLASLTRGDRTQAAFHAATFGGRVQGLRASSEATTLSGRS